MVKKPILGILMLNTNFYRPKGDIGNPETYSFSVAYHVIKNATIRRVVKLADTSLIEPFIKGAKILENKGVRAITTSCGFLALFQKEIQRELRVPFYASSLMQIPMVQQITGGTVGVITARRSSLTRQHLQGVQADRTPITIVGMEDMPAFTGAIVDETNDLDKEAIALEMKQVTVRLLENNPAIKAIVLECTNMPPYKNAIREVTRLPIFDINTLTDYVVRGL
ncbi:aspartate/glutamate racemase family protein [Oceanobacillus saliphilus]|uniref:aspartate/glutamate racemase family protein n=1 Tax=Oceanobacillus saliphilus TaxID=2925834 RepID=UPI00201E6DDC|nr:aspartate/glutamate racemase family protein [Oceanobacillus saliphilus]